jgi:hypothetical protein
VPPQDWPHDEFGRPLISENGLRPDSLNSEQQKRQREDEDAVVASETPSSRRRKRRHLRKEHPVCNTIFKWSDASSNGS